MRTIIKIAIILLLFSSCINNSKRDYVYLEINNKQLEREIVEFTKIAKNPDKEDSVVLIVNYWHINDSTMKFQITNCFNYEYEPFHFVCKVNGRDVYFKDTNLENRINNTKKEFFKLKKSTKDEITKKYYPSKLKEKTYIVGKDTFLIVPNFYSYHECTLTFIRDSLVEKRYRF